MLEFFRLSLFNLSISSSSMKYSKWPMSNSLNKLRSKRAIGGKKKFEISNWRETQKPPPFLPRLRKDRNREKFSYRRENWNFNPISGIKSLNLPYAIDLTEFLTDCSTGTFRLPISDGTKGFILRTWKWKIMGL